MSQTFRLRQGGRIERAVPYRFTFDGSQYEGYKGDTLASALLANGVRLIGRSFKYHRPRGILGSGVEEPNALIQLETGAFTEPNTKATQIELYDGLVSASQNCWPSLQHDLGRVVGMFSALLPAGFYYKTFKWPDWSWFEPLIRRAAGLGTAPVEPDVAKYAARFDHTEVLIVGSGPAGLAAAAVALRARKRVMLIEQQPALGGVLLDRATPELSKLLADLEQAASYGELTTLTRATAIAAYDHRMVSIVERITDRLGPAEQTHYPRQRFRLVRAGTVVLATGAIERPLLFPDNDRPGIMLASAVQAYCNRYAVLAGRKAIFHTAHDGAYQAAVDLATAGAHVIMVDLRSAPPPPLAELARSAGIELIAGHSIVGTHGAGAVRSVKIAPISGGGHLTLKCDLVAMSGGWTPTSHLHSMAGGQLRYDELQDTFVPAKSPPFVLSTGAAAGIVGLKRCIDDGVIVGDLSARGAAHREPPAILESRISKFTYRGSASRVFVDFQNDVTAADIELASREGLRSVEHVKRYTTLGMAVDQGKTSNVNGIAVLAAAASQEPGQVGTTKFRPPYVPITIGAFGGSSRGRFFRPRRLLATHERQIAHEAKLDDLGGSWPRPICYPRQGEDLRATIRREALAVRTRVGLFDSSPLGKIEVKGPDARTFVDRLYANSMQNLKTGRCRYGLMLNTEGVIMDDGILSCLDSDHFLVNTTSAGALRTAAWLEECHQCYWSDLRVAIMPVTTDWATLTLTGPTARDVLAPLVSGVDFDDFPHLSVREGRVVGIDTRIARVSYTGEVSYEVSVGWVYGASLWEHLMEAGADRGITPVGIEAWLLLRLEKGFIHVGGDTDGTTLPDDIGWGDAAARKTSDFIGKRSLVFHAARQDERLQLVGVEPAEPNGTLSEGTHLVSAINGKIASIGTITSVCESPLLNRWIGLARVRNGRQRLGEVIETENLGKQGRVRLVALTFYDRDGVRLRG